jgi:hypothetical protein
LGVVTGAIDSHGGKRTKLARVSSYDQRAGGRHQLHRAVAVNRRPFEQARGCRSWHRKDAVRTRHRAAANVQRRCDDVADPKPFEAKHRADNVDDRVERPDFVQVHALDWRAMNGRFRLRQALEQVHRALLTRFRQRRTLDRRDDVLQMMVLM